MDPIEARLRACELDNERLRARLGRQNRLTLLGLLLVAGSAAIAGATVKSAVFDSITAREVVVVDGHGKVRARLGGDLPDAVMAGGHAAPRGSKTGGLLIYDEEGIERGGYVTMDRGSNAMLTLDSKQRQAVLLMVGPSGDQDAALKLWSTGSGVALTANGDDAHIDVSDRAGVRLQVPPVSALTADACAYFRNLDHKYPGENACRHHYTEAACNACLHP